MLAASTAMTAQRQPVLVELFTSEGCSSCPPADALLEKLDRDQPVAGAQIIVLSEHVDYWNHDGWTDPFSSAAFTARQETYTRRFGIDGPYTPEMVVDGNAECNGSDARKAESAIRRAIGEPKVGIRMRAAASGEAAVTLEVDALPEGAIHKANIYVAHAADRGPRRCWAERIGAASSITYPSFGTFSRLEASVGMRCLRSNCRFASAKRQPVPG